MSASATAVRSSMRIVAFPLTRHVVGGMKKPHALSLAPTDTSDGGGDTPLTYYHFEITSRPPRREGGGGVVNTLMRKAGDIWAGFGKAPEGTWKVSTT